MPPIAQTRKRFLRIAVSGGIALIVIGLSIGIAPEQNFAWLDKPLLVACRDPIHHDILVGPQWIPGAVRDITALGSTIVLTVFALNLFGLLLTSKLYRSASIFAAASATGCLLMSIFKLFFSRIRPAELPALEVATGFSFPSGHAMMSTLIYLTFVFVIEEYLTRPQKIWLGLSCVLLAVAIGCTRVMLGVHYPSDVLAGWMVGGGLALCWAGVIRAAPGT